MSDLIYTLLSDGSSDSALMPILTWLLQANGVQCAIHGQWAELRWLRRPPAALAARLRLAVDLFPCELLFVHRDAEAMPRESRHNEIRSAVAEAFDNVNLLPWIPVIPVRMREAWLLFDEIAIRKAAGNPSGRVPLELPRLARCEDLPDPKALLEDILRSASGLSARRRAKLRVDTMMRRIPEYAREFSSLRALPAFAALEGELQNAVTANGWNRR